MFVGIAARAPRAEVIGWAYVALSFFVLVAKAKPGFCQLCR